MSTAIFRTQDGAFVPTEQARGPWDARALHGGAPAALMAGALELVPGGDKLIMSRLTYEFLRPVPLTALSLSTRVVRAGRRVQELEAELEDGEGAVCRVRALRLRPADVTSPLPQDVRALPGPDLGIPRVFSLDGSSEASFAATAMEMRWLDDPFVPGPARVWMRLRHPLIEGRAPTPLMRLLATADFGNGISAVLPFDDFLFINADLTVYLHRAPEGDWIGLDSRTQLSAGGAGLAESVLHDRHGPVGRSLQALIVQQR
jgi:hypothetical protein